MLTVRRPVRFLAALTLCASLVPFASSAEPEFSRPLHEVERRPEERKERRPVERQESHVEEKRRNEQHVTAVDSVDKGPDFFKKPVGGFHDTSVLKSEIAADHQRTEIKAVIDPATTAGYSGGAVRRSGVIDGLPTGEPERIPPNQPDKARGIRRQIESADTLAALGYDVEHQPTVRSSDVGVALRKNPDLRVGGEIFDVYSPISNNIDNVINEMAAKVNREQAPRLVVNLSDSSLTTADLSMTLAKYRVADLKELIVIDGKDSSVTRLFPDPVDLKTTRPQATSSTTHISSGN